MKFPKLFPFSLTSKTWVQLASLLSLTPNWALIDSPLAQIPWKPASYTIFADRPLWASIMKFVCLFVRRWRSWEAFEEENLWDNKLDNDLDTDNILYYRFLYVRFKSFIIYPVFFIFLSTFPDRSNIHFIRLLNNTL